MTTAAQSEMSLPANEAAEMAVLGAVLLDNAVFGTIELSAEDFYHAGHRLIWKVMSALHGETVGIDPVTITNELVCRGEIEAIGGVPYLSELTAGLPRAVNAVFYAEIVREKAMLRRMVHVGHDFMRQALEQADKPADILDRAGQAIIAIGKDGSKNHPIALREIAASTPLDSLIGHEGSITGVATGFTRLDNLTCGLHRGDLIVIAGRPSMGKTALALSLAAHIGGRNEPVLIFSLEMTRRALFSRLLCAEARVDSHAFRSGHLTKEHQVRIAQAAGRIAHMPIYIDDSPTLRLQELSLKAKSIKDRHGLQLLIVDYLGLMIAPRAENRNQEISALTRGLKALAKELEVPLVVISQLSRAPEHRGGNEGGHRPQLADLRDSGSIEQDADMVGLLYRKEYYLRSMGREVPDDWAGVAELIVAKQRNGPVDTVPLAFLGRFACFENLAEHWSFSTAAPAPDAPAMAFKRSAP